MSDTLILAEGLEARRKPRISRRKRILPILARRRRISEIDEGLDFTIKRRRYPVMEGLGIRASQTPEFRAAMKKAWRELKPPFSTRELLKKAWEIYRSGRISELDELEASPKTHPKVWSELMKKAWIEFKGKPRRKTRVSELAELDRRGVVRRRRRATLLGVSDAIIPKLDLTNILSLSLGAVATIYVPKALDNVPQVPDFLKTDVGKIITRLGVGVVGNLVLSKLLKKPEMGKQFFIGSLVITGLGVIDKYILGGKIGLADGYSSVASLSYYVPPEEQVVKEGLNYYVSPEEQVVTEEY
jgi:hypothetical protein